MTDNCTGLAEIITHAGINVKAYLKATKFHEKRTDDLEKGVNFLGKRTFDHGKGISFLGRSTNKL